jgi:signal transduction histidine kinase
VLVNAIKYSPQGGEILVTLCAADAAEGGWVTIRIRDHGVGIPTAEVSRVFDRFYRASNVSGQMTGTGLGLSGVRHVVEQHGGTIDLASTEGASTTVTIRLPRHTQGDAQDAPVAPSS